jgi:hypothetical protein
MRRGGDGANREPEAQSPWHVPNYQVPGRLSEPLSFLASEAGVGIKPGAQAPGTSPIIFLAREAGGSI